MSQGLSGLKLGARCTRVRAAPLLSAVVIAAKKQAQSQQQCSVVLGLARQHPHPLQVYRPVANGKVRRYYVPCQQKPILSSISGISKHAVSHHGHLRSNQARENRM